MSTTNLHVIFGTGPLGKSVMHELLKQGGASIRMVNRSGKRGNIPAEVEVVAGDAYQAESVRKLTAGASVAYQCAQPEYHEWAEHFPPLQAAIIEGLTGSSTRLVIGENLYAYGDPQGQALTESTPMKPHTRKGAIRKALIEAWMAAHAAGKLPIAGVRGSDFYGPEDPLSGRFTFYPLLAGKAVSPLGSLDYPHTMTYIRDFGRTMVAVGAHPDAMGQAWHVPSHTPTSLRAYLTELFSVAGLPPKMGVTAKWMVNLLGMFIPPMKETVEMMYQWTAPFTMDSSKAQRVLGIQATPQQQAFSESLAWFKANPQPKG